MDDGGSKSLWAMPRGAWKDVALSTWREAGDDNIGLIAAGVAFYGFLAMVPLLGAMVLSYGLAVDPATVIAHVQHMAEVMPPAVAGLIGEQLLSAVHTSDSKKGLGLLLALGVALFGARNGAGAVVTALNIAYEEKEKRGFVAINLLALAITLASVVALVVAAVAMAGLSGLADRVVGAPPAVAIAGKVFTYALMLAAGAAGAAALYRFGPSRREARWMWISPGSLLASLAWLAVTLGFGVYVSNFGHYNATYGSLGAVVMLLTWLYLTSYALMFGAELNAEIEHRSAGAPLR